MAEVSAYFETLYKSLQKDYYYQFLRQVDWTEHWILTIIAVHLTILVSLVVLRKYHTYILSVLFISTAIVLNASHINDYVSRTWFNFAKKNYFDVSGFFITVLISLPLLFNCVLASMLLLYQAAVLLLEVKTKQIKKKKQ